jgi:hypothetical protein
MGNYKWSDQEIDILEQIVNRYPRKELPEIYNKKAKKLGFRKRSFDAIIVKATRVYKTLKPTEENYTYHELARILGLPVDWVRKWKVRGQLQVSYSGVFTKITNEQLDEFRHKHPELLAMGSYDGLVFIFGDAIAKEIKTHKPLYPVLVEGKKVRNKKTGKIYNSIREAAKYEYCHRTTIKRQARKGGYYEFVE